MKKIKKIKTAIREKEELKEALYQGIKDELFRVVWEESLEPVLIGADIHFPVLTVCEGSLEKFPIELFTHEVVEDEED